MESRPRYQARIMARWMLGLLAAAVPAWAQISISSIQASPVGNPAMNVTGITSGASFPQLRLYLNGSFPYPAAPTSVTWFNTSTNTTYVDSAPIVTIPQIQGTIPSAFYAVPVTSTQTVLVTVTQGLYTATTTFYVYPPPAQVAAQLPLATTGTAYSQPLFVGGTPPFSGSGTGAPPGMSVVNGGALISGTPTTPGIYTVQTGAADAWSVEVGGSYSLQVIAPATVTSVVPGAAPAGSGMLQIQVGGTNFVDPESPAGGSQVQWTFNGNTTFLNTAYVSGNQLLATVPTALMSAPGTAVVAVLQPNDTAYGGQPFVLSPPSLTGLSPASVIVGSPALVLTLSGANFADRTGAQDVLVGPYQPQVQFGNTTLQGQLVSQQARIVVMVTVPAQLLAVAGTVPVRVVNPGGSTSGAQNFTVIGILSIATPGLPGGSTGTSYLFRLTAAGGAAPFQWSATGLPNGLSLNPATGDISGTPLVSGSYTVSVRVTDASQQQATRSYPLTIGPPPPSISTSTLPNGTVGIPYAANLDISNSGSGFTFQVSAGRLPDGLTLSGGGGITGTPTRAGSFDFTVAASDGQVVLTRSLTILILPNPLIIRDPSATLTVGTAARIAFSASGGVPTYRFTLDCALPDGLSFSAGNGIISGTPSTPGTTSCHVTATDSAGTTASLGFTITVLPQAITFSGGALPNGQVGVDYSAQIAARGGTPPLSYSGSGLPDGLSLASNGAISGRPTTAGQFSFTATVTDAGRATATATFTITIAPAALSITTRSLPDGVVGVAYSAALAAAGGAPPYTWNITGLPSGVSANAAGALSGTPDTPGGVTVVATVTDSTRATATARFAVTIAAPPLGITTASLPSGTVGAAYSASLAASGGIPPLTWSASGLPGGLSISSAGSISGTPAAPGSSSVTVTVRDSAGTSASKTFTLAVSLPATPPLSYGGVSGTAPPLQQPTLTVTLASPYPVDVLVTLTLTFTPDSGADDPSIQFATGGRTARITIPAGATSGSTGVGVQTGTVAGTIAIVSQMQAAGQDVTPSPAPRQTIRIAATAPVLTAVAGTRTSTGFTITATGYVTDREVTQAVFQFNPAAGTNLQTSSLTVTLDSLFAAYFGGAAAAPYGGQFTFTQPFTVNGNLQGIASVTVTVTNRVGSSTPITVNLN